MKRLLLTVCALTGVFAGQAEDAYLESDGTQALNLGYIAKPTTRIEYDFQLLPEAAKGAFVCGVYGGDLSYGVWKNGGGNFEFRFNGVWSGGLGLAADLQRHVCTIDMATGTCRLLTDGSEAASHIFTALPTKNASYPIAAFAGSSSVSGTAFSYRAATRLYWIKVYESDTLVHSFVPCVKGEKAGFLDEKSGRFLAPDIAVASGGDIRTIDEDPYVSTPDGGVIVDTGYYCSENTRLECDYEMLDDTTTDQFLFSAGLNKRFEVRGYVGTKGDGTVVINYQFSTNSARASTSTPVGKDIRRTLTIDGVAGTASLVTGVTTNYAAKLANPYGGTCVDTLRLFCISSESTAKCAKMKLYGFRIYEGGVLVRDYRPALIDGVAVLSDVVGGSWIKSKTAKELSSGGAIAENNDAYLESDGTQGINLGYKVKTTSRVEVDFRYLSAGKASHNRLLIGGGAAVSATQNPIRFGMTQNSSGYFEFCFPEMKAGNYWSGSLFAADTKRHVGILDVPNSKGSYTRFGSAQCNKTSTTNLTADSTYPLGLFGSTSSTDGNTFTDSYSSSVRIYDVKIYESNVLVKHWIPYVHNGELGLKETVSGTFLDCNNGRKALPNAGGAIGYDSCPPYVESDGTQCVNLGVKPKKNARIETAFSRCYTNMLNMGIVGSVVSSATPNKSFLWLNKNGGMEACLNGKYSGSFSGAAGFGLHSCVFDYAAHTVYGDGVAKVLDVTAPTADATYPTGVFGLVNNTAGTGFSYTGIKARVYYVKIYEGDTLTNEFVPWVKDGVVGFRDTVTDAFVTKYQSSAAALKIGGVGTTCAIEPAVCTVRMNGVATLTAGASGAVSYKWFRNGVEIDGETEPTLSVAWRRQRANDVYSVRPVYQLYGESILGDAVEATVAYAKLGLIFVVK